MKCCNICKMPQIDWGMDRCFGDKKDESVEPIDSAYEGMSVSFNGKLFGKIENVTFRNPPQIELIEVKPLPPLRNLFLYKLYDLCHPEIGDVKDEDFEVGETESFVTYNITREEMDQDLLKRAKFCYTPFVRTIDELTNHIYEGPLPVGTWVQKEGQFYYSADGKNWISQLELFPDDYNPKDKFPIIPKNLLEIRDGNI